MSNRDREGERLGLMCVQVLDLCDKRKKLMVWPCEEVMRITDKD
jgi:hypothetical protein